MIASRILEDAEGRGTTAFLVPAERRPTAVMASAYNRMRQRSDVAQAALE